jgi:hypothetical protein
VLACHGQLEADRGCSTVSASRPIYEVKRKTARERAAEKLDTNADPPVETISRLIVCRHSNTEAHILVK